MYNAEVEFEGDRMDIWRVAVRYWIDISLV